MTPIIRQWQTRNRDEVFQTLADIYSTSVVNMPRAGTKFHFDIKVAKVEDLLLTRYHTTGLRVLATNNQSFHFVIMLSGVAGVRIGTRDVVSKPFYSGHILPPEGAFDLDSAPPCTALGLNVPKDILCKHASDYFGRACVAPRTLQSANLQTPIGEALSRNMLACFNEMVRLEASKLSQLAETSFSELLLNLLSVVTFANGDTDAAPRAVGRNAVERARLFIDAFASDAIRISDVAKTVGVSVRALELGFHKTVACSPMQYLLMRRLELARARLTTPSSRETVTTIASECGFLNLGLFAKRYRDRYGELPSETLRRSRMKA